MNLDIFKNVDSSGKFSKESFLFKNHREEYDYIIEYCKINNIFDLSFKEKVYLCVNKLIKVPICQNHMCGKKVKFKNSTIGYLKYCSNSCVSSDPNIKKIKEEKSLEKFGTKTPAESKLIKEKIIKTNQKKWGGNSPMSSKEVYSKSKKTLLDNWGVDNPSKSTDILEKRIKSFKNNIENYKESYKRTSMLKYGVEHPWKNTTIHKKSIDKTKDVKRLSLYKIILKMIPKNYLLNSIDKETNEVNITCNLKHEFRSTRNFIYNRFRQGIEICTICNSIDEHKSGSQILLTKFIKEIYDGEIIENERKIIRPFEIDIYLPDINLGIEYNGLWWHSSEYREYNYHLLKKRRADELGLNLISIWEDDWINKPDVVKSLIISKLGKIEKKIHANICEIEELDKKNSDSFLEKNDINGKSNSSVRLCLMYNGEIVSVMTFKKNNGGWILDRFCEKNYLKINNSFDKLFYFFIEKYNPISIITYTDNMIQDGEIYEKFGFECLSEITPTYEILVGKKRMYRFSRANSNEYPKIYNAGLKKWIFNNKLT